MPRGKVTTDDQLRLVDFGREMTRRMDAEGVNGPTEVSRRAEGKISTGYVSDIMRVARGDSPKSFRLSREKVELIATVLHWPINDALSLAGLSASRTASAEPGEHRRRKKSDPVEEAMLIGLSRKIDADGLSEEGEQQMLAMLRRDLQQTIQ